ncbi:hypothetical protein ABID58_007285 [Bradyrhizobium sp. S3.2.6]|uniref:hypothetical protein n=1 Tax=Bradyrhizobium sp. S3.2.6 TaxID=3156428 RepID=UPI0033940C57
MTGIHFLLPTCADAIECGQAGSLQLVFYGQQLIWLCPSMEKFVTSATTEAGGRRPCAKSVGSTRPMAIARGGDLGIEGVSEIDGHTAVHVKPERVVALDGDIRQLARETVPERRSNQSIAISLASVDLDGNARVLCLESAS